MTLEFVLLIAVGFFAQLVDGALGMAFGLIATTAMLSLGLPPAQASAATHTAEVFTTGVSGLSHLYFRNIQPRLFLTLSLSGVGGGVLGAYILSNVDGKAIRPFIAAYLLILGLLILMKAFRLSPTSDDAKTGHAAPLGLVGGFLDAIGGGGWGPIVTSNLLARGHALRLTVGSVNAVEFFVTLTASAVFLATLGTAHFGIVLGLALGGMVAAPLGAWLVRFVKPRALMPVVGLLVVVVSVRTLYTSFA